VRFVLSCARAFLKEFAKLQARMMFLQVMWHDNNKLWWKEAALVFQ